MKIVLTLAVVLGLAACDLNGPYVESSAQCEERIRLKYDYWESCVRETGEYHPEQHICREIETFCN